MRIIAGEFKGRTIDAPKGRNTRPTTDRIRESLFNWLHHHDDIYLQGAVVGDFFAGSGALGLEALSRGAEFAFFCETDRSALQCLKSNIEKLGVTRRVKIFSCDATRLPKAQKPCDLLFLDPPYGQGLGEKFLRHAMAQGWLHKQSKVILEASSNEITEFKETTIENVETRQYGSSALHLLQPILEK